MTLPAFNQRISLGLISTEYGPDQVISSGGTIVRAGNIIVNGSFSFTGTLTIWSIYGSVTFTEGTVVSCSGDVNIRASTIIKIYQISATGNVRLLSDQGGANSIKKWLAAPASSAGTSWNQAGYGDVVAVDGTVITLVNTPIVRMPSSYGTYPISNTSVDINYAVALSSFTAPDGYNSVDGFLVGGGGGGGGGTASFNEGLAGGSGGGGGGYIQWAGATIIAGQSGTYQVGAGGAGASDTYSLPSNRNRATGGGGGGGAASFVTLSNWSAYAYGGQGAGSVVNWTVIPTNATGGSFNSTNLSIVASAAGSSGSSQDESYNGGAGGASGSPGSGGAGGAAFQTSAATGSGATGSLYGGGGGGGGAGYDQGGCGGGGAGANGRLFVTWKTTGSTNYRIGGYDATVVFGSHSAQTVGSLTGFFTAAVSGQTQLNMSSYYAGGSRVTAGQIGYKGGSAVAVPSAGQISIGNFHGSTFLVPIGFNLTNGGVTSGWTTWGTTGLVYTRAGIEFRSNGTLYTYEYINSTGGSPTVTTSYVQTVGQWLTTGSASGAEIYASLASGISPTSGPALNTWLPLSVTRLWYVQCASASQTNVSQSVLTVLNITIRSVLNNSISVSAQISLNATADWDASGGL